MRKITILEENYMALEQAIATAIDSADKRLEGSLSSMKGMLDTAFTGITGESFHMEPSFIEFKSKSGIKELLSSVKEKITSSAAKLKDVKNIPLEKAAIISKSYAKLNGKSKDDYDDEVHEVVYFFDKENSDIPDNKDNKFEVIISDGKSAIKKFGEIQEAFDSVSKEIEAGLEGKISKEKLYEAVDRLVLLKELASVFAE
jgi:hypothetical protein